MLPKGEDYGSLVRGFQWDIPAQLNMACQVCDDWADRAPDRLAIIDMTGDARVDVSYGTLRRMADTLAVDLVAKGVRRRDRVGVLRSQSPWTAAAHIACWKLGAISIPLFKLFGTDALLTRLEDAGVAWVIADPEGTEGLRDWLAMEGHDQVIPEELVLSDIPFDTAHTAPEEPAVLIYTSGTTGAPKGALHAHRVLIGHLPGVEVSHDFLGREGDCLWTPADWAWIGGLFDVLMPGLALGVPVVAARMDKFSVAECQRIVAATSVRNVFFPPTALRMLKAEGAALSGLRSVASGGEPLGAEMLAWGRQAFGVTINEFYGQTECNMVASSCGALFDAAPGCLGKPAPGFDIAVLDEDGQPTDTEGDIAIRKGAASMMLGYWNRPEATAEKFYGDWMLTGDRGQWQGDYLRFVGREDDVITSAGYRIGPAEIEDCLLKHPAVATVGVIGKPDPLRTEIVKAYVVLKPGHAPSDTLARALQDFAKDHVAKHSYPREIAFTDALPMTVTGKVIRKELKRLAAEECA
ncbi:AMP-binding protein [Thalassovita sp.]|uniref:AMP-binding protein n=1 Tax=Thalassovita sp. TaxID=1979401 RepID=UPI003B5C48E2